MQVNIKNFALVTSQFMLFQALQLHGPQAHDSDMREHEACFVFDLKFPMFQEAMRVVREVRALCIELYNVETSAVTDHDLIFFDAREYPSDVRKLFLFIFYYILLL